MGFLVIDGGRKSTSYCYRCHRFKRECHGSGTMREKWLTSIQFYSKNRIIHNWLFTFNLRSTTIHFYSKNLNIRNWILFFNLRKSLPYMSVNCNECGSATVWDDDVGSAVCTSCGSLTDPSQSVLTSAHWDHHNDTTDSTSTTLKCLRSRNNWDLAGQGKESRDRKNMVNILLALTIVTVY
jgi:hypothetical protein